MIPTRAVAVVGFVIVGCGSESVVRETRTPMDLMTYFEAGGYDILVEEGEGSLPGGAIERWKVDFREPFTRRLGYLVPGSVYTFMYPRMAEDYVRALEGTRDQAMVSGVLVMVLRKPRYGFTDMEESAVPGTPGLKDAFKRWRALADENKKTPNSITHQVIEAADAGQLLFDKEWSGCVNELLARFSTFRKAPP